MNQPNDFVRLVMELAVAKFGGTGETHNVFNAAEFSNALYELCNLKGSMDGIIVRAILTGRTDVEPFGGAHFRLIDMQGNESDEASEKSEKLLARLESMLTSMTPGPYVVRGYGVASMQSETPSGVANMVYDNHPFQQRLPTGTQAMVNAYAIATLLNAKAEILAYVRDTTLMARSAGVGSLDVLLTKLGEALELAQS